MVRSTLFDLSFAVRAGLVHSLAVSFTGVVECRKRSSAGFGYGLPHSAGVVFRLSHSS